MNLSQQIIASAPTIVHDLRRRAVSAIVIGVLYACGALGIAAILAWATLLYDRPQPLPLSAYDMFWMSLLATSLALASVWYIYAGTSLLRLPPPDTVRPILTITVIMAVVSLAGLLSVWVLYSTSASLARLDQYRQWRRRYSGI